MTRRDQEFVRLAPCTLQRQPSVLSAISLDLYSLDAKTTSEEALDQVHLGTGSRVAGTHRRSSVHSVTSPRDSGHSTLVVDWEGFKDTEQAD